MGGIDLSGGWSELFVSDLAQTDEEMEVRVKPNRRRLRSVPWYRWESEFYSLGTCIRRNTSYPSFLPLLINSDHGVDRQSVCWPNERIDTVPVYLSWYEKKVQKLRDIWGVNAIHVEHPWVTYGLGRAIASADENRGVALFLPHSNDQTKPQFNNKDVVGWIETLGRDDVVLVVQMHDVNKGLHKRLRSLGIPQTTLGYGGDPHYVDRFYTLMHTVDTVASPNVGSHTMFAIECGRHFIKLPDVPYVATDSAPLPTGLVDPKARFGDALEYEERREFEILLEAGRSRDPRVVAYVNSALGVDASMSQEELRELLFQPIRQSPVRAFNLYIREVWKRHH